MYDLSVESLHVLSVFVWVQNMHMRRTGHSEFSVGVCVSATECFPRCGPVMNWTRPRCHSAFALCDPELRK